MGADTMRVLQILYSGLGGHGSVAFSLAAAARSEGDWQNAFIFLGIEPTLPEYQAACATAGHPQIEVRTRPGAPWLSWGHLYRAMARLQPEAIVLHSVKAIIPCTLYARRYGIPLVAVEHQPNVLKSPAEWWVSRRLQTWADAVVVLTAQYRSDLQIALGTHWKDDQVHLIPNGIDTRVFSPISRHERCSVRTIGMAARMTTMKRQEVLIDALASLSRDGDDSWRLSLAGDGETCGALRAHAEARGVQDAVEFTGFLGEPDLVRWFQRIDFYAHASNGETLSTSLLQALAMGLPIIGSDVPGINDLLAEDAGVGLLVSQEAAAFAAAFRKLEADPAGAEALGSRARKLAVDEFSNDVMFARYNRLIASL